MTPRPSVPDPFGGDPFKEVDPFKASSEDFFKKTTKVDPFATPDPFNKSGADANTKVSPLERSADVCQSGGWRSLRPDSLCACLSCLCSKAATCQAATPSPPATQRPKDQVGLCSPTGPAWSRD